MPKILKASVKRMPIEVGTASLRNPRPSYRWVQRFVLVSPDGKTETHPPMRFSECRKLAKANGWRLLGRVQKYYD